MSKTQQHIEFILLKKWTIAIYSTLLIYWYHFLDSYCRLSFDSLFFSRWQIIIWIWIWIFHECFLLIRLLSYRTVCMWHHRLTNRQHQNGKNKVDSTSRTTKQSTHWIVFEVAKKNFHHHHHRRLFCVCRYMFVCSLAFYLICDYASEHVNLINLYRSTFNLSFVNFFVFNYSWFFYKISFPLDFLYYFVQSIALLIIPVFIFESFRILFTHLWFSVNFIID